MNSVDFIKKGICSLAETFPTTCFKYGFDESIKTHIIEITPAQDFYGDEKLSEAWISLSVSFMTDYPSEDIVFISSDSTLVLSEYKLTCNEEKVAERKDKEGAMLNPLFQTLLLGLEPLQFTFEESVILTDKSDAANLPVGINENNIIDFSDQFLMAA